MLLRNQGTLQLFLRDLQTKTYSVLLIILLLMGTRFT